MARRVTSNENLTGSSVALRKNLDMDDGAGRSGNYDDWIVLADKERLVFAWFQEKLGRQNAPSHWLFRGGEARRGGGGGGWQLQRPLN